MDQIMGGVKTHQLTEKYLKTPVRPLLSPDNVKNKTKK